MRKKTSDSDFIEPVNPERMDEYEDLLVKREQYFKTAQSRKIDYLNEFGELSAAVFEAKIECIRLKKTITYCRKMLNLGQKIDTEDLQKTIQGEMMFYKAELEEMLTDNERAKNAKVSDAYDVEQSKKIYRRLMKRLHPDINAKTEKLHELMELWMKIQDAYRRNSVEELEELEVMTNQAMKRLGEDGFALKVSGIDQKIERVKKQIEEILTTKPYTYGELLCDKEAVNAKKEELKKELSEYKAYKDELEKILEELLAEGGAAITWQMTL